MDLTAWIIVCLGFLARGVLTLGKIPVQYVGPQLVSEGDTFSLSCVIPSADNSATWTLNGSVVIDEDNLLGYELLERKLYSFYKEMVLSSASAQLFHTGEYRCSRNSRDHHYVRVVEDAEAARTTTEGTETPPPSKHTKRDGGRRFPRRYYFEVNNSYQFACEVDDEEYAVLWFKNMRQLDSSSYPNIELYDRYLTIHNAQVGDVGEYACILDASYQPGKRDVVSRYVLTTPAEIVDMSGKQNVIRGRSMTIYCRAKGYPPPRITWYIGNLNAYMLKEKDLRISIYSRREELSNTYLTVRNMTNFDRGRYTCRAENGIKTEEGEKYHEKSIPVYVRENIIEPNEDEPGVGKVLVPGEPLLLQCKTEECPLCSIVWFKEGEMLTTDANGTFIDEENNSLLIHSAQVNDTGVYECAVNRAVLNVDLRATIKVQVCEDLLSEGFTIESICEMPVIVSKASNLRRHSVVQLMYLVFLASLSTRITSFRF